LEQQQGASTCEPREIVMTAQALLSKPGGDPRDDLPIEVDFGAHETVQHIAAKLTRRLEPYATWLGEDEIYGLCKDALEEPNNPIAQSFRQLAASLSAYQTLYLTVESRMIRAEEHLAKIAKDGPPKYDSAAVFETTSSSSNDKSDKTALQETRAKLSESLLEKQRLLERFNDEKGALVKENRELREALTSSQGEKVIAQAAAHSRALDLAAATASAVSPSSRSSRMSPSYSSPFLDDQDAFCFSGGRLEDLGRDTAGGGLSPSSPGGAGSFSRMREQQQHQQMLDWEQDLGSWGKGDNEDSDMHQRRGREQADGDAFSALPLSAMPSAAPAGSSVRRAYSHSVGSSGSGPRSPLGRSSGGRASVPAQGGNVQGSTGLSKANGLSNAQNVPPTPPPPPPPPPASDRLTFDPVSFAAIHPDEVMMFDLMI
jgi:hypothetical protein